jgi:hypothetical protein
MRLEEASPITSFSIHVPGLLTAPMLEEALEETES